MRRATCGLLVLQQINHPSAIVSDDSSAGSLLENLNLSAKSCKARTVFLYSFDTLERVKKMQESHRPSSPILATTSSGSWSNILQPKSSTSSSCLSQAQDDEQERSLQDNGAKNRTKDILCFFEFIRIGNPPNFIYQHVKFLACKNFSKKRVRKKF